MAKSRAEMMELVAKLLAEYAEFRHRRPDLPQGDLRDLSDVELDILSPNFSATGRLKQTTLIQHRRDLCSIERRLEHSHQHETWTQGSLKAGKLDGALDDDGRTSTDDSAVGKSPFYPRSLYAAAKLCAPATVARGALYSSWSASERSVPR
jgi:hypothetical protein